MKHTLLALTLTASSAFAQQPPAPPPAAPAAQVDARFAAWLGCWRLDDDLAGTGARMCITPEKTGVRLQTVAGTQRGIDELVIPDNTARPISDSECKGTERAEWSKDGSRIFRTTEVTCGKEMPRVIKTVAFMAPGPSWISVQHVTGTTANTAVRVQRYRRSSNQLLADGTRAQQPSADLISRTTAEQTKWDVDDVIEASGKIPVESVQASLAEVHQPFDLNKNALLSLHKSEVDESIIDLMVALTYPKRFVVKSPSSSGSAIGVSSGTGWFDPFMAPMLSTGSFYDCYSPYGYGYRSYYSMCGAYGMYGGGYYYPYYGYGYYPGYGGGWVTVQPPINGGGTITPQPDGRVVNGRGYTQIHDRQVEPAPRVSSGGGNGTAAGWSGHGGGATSGGYSSGGASAGSSGGGGSTSAGDSGVRTAVPKGGGGR
ncbi:MAG TPA: hypothetical protein VF491_05470 [Vicinamibacterales bacterium]